VSTRKRILVCGGFGYLGARTAEHLERAEFRVVRGTRREKAPVDREYVGFLHVPFSDKEALERTLLEFDAVVYFATPNEVFCDSHFSDALKASLSNLGHVCAILGATQTPLVYASTVQVYGDALKGDVTEAKSPLPNRDYARVHAACEELLHAHARSTGAPTVVARISNVIGAPPVFADGRWSLLANDFCRQAARTQEIVVKARQDVFRDFVGCLDVTRAMEFLLDKVILREADGIYNVSGEHSLSISTFARLVERVATERCNLPTTTRFCSDFLGNPTQPAFSVSRKRLLSLGFSYAEDLEASIERCLRDALKGPTT
jgi:UDP-glucose 4-epimerase